MEGSPKSIMQKQAKKRPLQIKQQIINLKVKDLILKQKVEVQLKLFKSKKNIRLKNKVNRSNKQIKMQKSS